MSETLTGLFSRIADKSAARSEAQLQADVAMFLRLAPMNLSEEDIDQIVLESQLGDGTRRRIDIEVGNCIVEVKKDLFKGTVLTDAEDQLAGYLETADEKTDIKHAGVLTDGGHWRLYRLAGPQQLDLVNTLDISPSGDVDALTVWLETILATKAQIKPIPEDIRRFLGVESNTYKLDHLELRRLFDENSTNKELALKRHLWARLLRTALGTSFTDDPDLFVDHSLLVLEASIIAHAVLGVDLRNADPVAVVDGANFREAQLFNVIENDFFDWVVSVPGGPSFVRELIRKISRFAWVDVEHDVLKVLYESVISAGTRKNLGEYYTPDWLAARIVQKVITDPLSQKVLDPSCGSGTFVFHTIKHHLKAADEAGLDNEEALESVQQHVFGMDIHPVSVVLARVTYLLAIGLERLGQDRGSLTVPVYLGDSMQWGATADSMKDETFTVQVDSPDLAVEEQQLALFDTGEKLAFPLATITDAGVFDRLVSDLADLAQTHTDKKKTRPSPQTILNSYGVVDGGDRTVLMESFNILCDLNADGRNHIWGYFVRNQVRPLWFSFPERQVDILVGNPPWVAYRFMTEAMQSKFRTFSANRNLWTGRKVATQQDLVGLFIARVVEQFLSPTGSFGFVTPKAVLTRQQYEGFRTGKWATKLPSTATQKDVTVRVEFSQPWDLQAVRPAIFPVPSAAVFGKRSASAKALPLQVHKFSGLVSARSISVETINAGLVVADGDLDSVSSADVAVSPYAKAVFQGANVVPRYLFCVTERAKSPLGHAKGLTPVESFRTNLEKEPWKLQPSLSGNIENAFLHPLHLGSTLAHYRLLDPWLAVLPISDGKLLDEGKISSHKHLAEWWSRASAEWEKHKAAATKLSLMEQVDYQGKLRKQLGKGNHRVAYSASGTRLVAAYVDDPDIVIEHALYWLAVPSEQAGHYLAAILNSQGVLDLVGKYQAQGLFGARHFDKYVWNLPIPLFNARNEGHVELSELGQKAAAVAATSNVDDRTFQKARELIREDLKTAGIYDAVETAVKKILSAG
ncbi:N-6 DNA methylase [Arthrobacter sp. MP_2.3]|uniref:N-6 DNA methylase n=1 Tax=Arthrobacter sp. MP_2.3 TaxID=3349633 RepID=UPI0038D3AAD2